MTKAKRKRSTVIFSIYLYRKCARTKQEGYIRLNEPRNQAKGNHFDYLDEIPRKIRSFLKDQGLTYEVADQTDDTVIEEKRRHRAVVKKIRKGDRR